MFSEVKRGVLFTIVTMMLFGGAYPVVLWGIGRAVFPFQAEGSLIRRADGAVVGSRLIAQNFTRDEYFHPRPSAVDYNAASTGGSNHGPSNSEHLDAVSHRVEALMKLEAVPAGEIPADMVTASGGGLDPHISPAAAELQAERVARARGIPVQRVRDLIGLHTEGPSLGLLGLPRVNVLELNMALER